MRIQIIEQKENRVGLQGCIINDRKFVGHIFVI